MEIKNRTIALLIDSDNISAKYLDLLINEVSKFGNITYKRIYGDFTAPTAASWRKILNEYAIEPIQQYLLVPKPKDKDREITFNVTDSAMIIDAMDILYKHNADCVCLATSDSDFTRLAIRFRNENYLVIGVGEKKTPQSFIAACHRFILIDALLAESEKPAEEQVEAKVEVPPTEVTPPQPNATLNDEKQEESEDETSEESTPMPKDKVVEISKEIIHESANDDGWILMSTFMHHLYLRVNTFDPRFYGYKTPTLCFRELSCDGNETHAFELKKNDKNADIIRIAD